VENNLEGLNITSKREFEKVFNELLKTNIKWSLLRYQDLVELAVLFEHPEVLLKRLGVEKEMGKRKIIEAGIETVKEITNQWQGQGPVKRLIKKLFEE